MGLRARCKNRSEAYTSPMHRTWPSTIRCERVDTARLMLRFREDEVPPRCNSRFCRSNGKPRFISRSAKPVISLIDPISARILIRHENFHDVLRVFIAEFRRHPELHREAIFGRQLLAVVSECE